MSMVVLNHIKGFQVTTTDVMYIYHAKRSRILYEWYLSPWSGMEGFITEGPITNKEINQKIVVMSGHWEFGVFEPKGLPRVSRVHGTPGRYF